MVKRDVRNILEVKNENNGETSVDWKRGLNRSESEAESPKPGSH